MDEYGSDEKNAMLNALQRPVSLKFKSTDSSRFMRNSNKVSAYNTTVHTTEERKTQSRFRLTTAWCTNQRSDDLNSEVQSLSPSRHRYTQELKPIQLSKKFSIRERTE